MASFGYYLVLFLYLHACTATARLVFESGKKGDDHLQPSFKALDGGSSIVQLHNHDFSTTHGKKIKTSLSRKILSQATGTEKWKKAGENVSNKDEEIEVMDYAQPHRKPPIHNKGT